MASGILEQMLINGHALPNGDSGLPPVLETPGERLKRVREAAGLSQGALAEQLGCGHRSSIGNVESGRALLQGALLAWVEAQEKGGAK